VPPELERALPPFPGFIPLEYISGRSLVLLMLQEACADTVSSDSRPSAISREWGREKPPEEQTDVMA